LSAKHARSQVRKRSVKIGKFFTSVSVEGEFWTGLQEIARERQLSVNILITDIHKQRTHANLSSVIRLFVLDYYRRLAEERAER
jgi:predicted DNA-binding ribbon-helix-helix protein